MNNQNVDGSFSSGEEGTQITHFMNRKHGSMPVSTKARLRSRPGNNAGLEIARILVDKMNTGIENSKIIQNKICTSTKVSAW